MDLASRIQEVEQAASILLNPYQVNRDLLKQSENVFINFAKSRLPLQLCFEILEKSNVELVLFETVKLIKNVVVYEWNGMTPEDKNFLRQKLMNFVIQRQDLQPSVGERIMQVVAIIIKRKYIEDKGVELGELLEDVRKMIFESGNPRTQGLSCHLVVTLLQEFSNTVNSEDVTLGFEEHFLAKKAFEVKELLQLFQLILKGMEELTSVLDITNESHFQLLEYFLKIMETILSWSYLTAFIPKRLIRLLTYMENANNVKQMQPLRLLPQWRALMLNPRTLELFFVVYWKIRGHPQLQRKGINCLIQLSTLSGPIFNDSSLSFKYFESFILLLLELLKTIDVDERDAFGISAIIRKLLVIHYVKVEFVKLSDDVSNALLERMLILTINFCENAAKENNQFGDTIYTEASKHMLEAWLEIINLVNISHCATIRQHTKIIFNKFIECRLMLIDNPGDDREVNETEECEKEHFKEELTIIGFLARVNPEHSMQSLSHLLDEKIMLLCTRLSQLQPNSSFNESISNNMSGIFDNLHWILMIAGHVLCMECFGEHALIPKEICIYSIEQVAAGQTDSQSSLDCLMKATELTVNPIENPAVKCDLVIRIITSVIRLCEIENKSISSGMLMYWSPLMSSTLMWFWGMWSTSYAFLNLTQYQEISPIYKEILGAENGIGSKLIMDYILGKICFNMHQYHSEIDVVDQSIKLFLDIVNIRNQRLKYVIELENFQSIMRIKDIQLDSKIKKNVYKGLVLAANAFKEPEQKYACLNHILTPINVNFQGLKQLLSETGTTCYQNTDVRMKVLGMLDEIAGVASGANITNIEYIFKEFQGIFQHLSQIMGLYHNYIDITNATLRILIELAAVSMAGIISPEISQEFYSYCFNCFRVYFQHNQTRIEKDFIDDDEDSPDDIGLVIDLLKKLTLHYMLQPNDTEEFSILAQIGFFVLENLLPKIYPILQKFPNICIAYYKTINCFLQNVISSESSALFSGEVMNHIIYTLRIGLTSFTYPDIQSQCLELLSGIGQGIIDTDDDTKNQQCRLAIVEPFIQLLFDIIVTLDLHSENKSDCFNAIYSLSNTLFPRDNNVFHSTLNQLLIEKQQKLGSAGSYLFDNPEVEELKKFHFEDRRDQKKKFYDLFDKFISSISFLYHN